MSGRKLSEDALYARELGIESTRYGKKTIRRLGGASKLRSLSPEARNLLLAHLRNRRSSVEGEENLVE